MKVTVSVACIAVAVVPSLVESFGPGLTHVRPTVALHAALDDQNIPDIVKAYQRVKPEPRFPDLPKIPENPTPDPVVALPQPVPLPVPVPVPTPVPVPVVEPLPTPLPELKVDFPVEAPPVPEIPSVVSDSLQSIKQSLPSISIQETADKVNAQFKGLNDFMKATQEQVAVRASERVHSNVPTLGEMLQNGMLPKRATFTESTMVPQPKAPTLVEYILGGLKSPTAPGSTDHLAETKAHLGLLVENTFSMFGKTSPENANINLPGNMSPETATTLAIASVAVLVIAGQNNKRLPTPQEPVSIEVEEDGPLAELAKDVKKMAEQIQRLSDETKSLRAELRNAQDRLTQKELDISKEKLRSADAELQLKREVQKVTLKLQESEAKNRALEKELAATEEMRVTLAISLEKIQALEDQLRLSAKDKDPVSTATTTATAAPAKDKDPVPPVPTTVKVEAPKPAPVKKASSRKKSVGVKGSAAKAETPKTKIDAPAEVEAPKSKKMPSSETESPKMKTDTPVKVDTPKSKKMPLPVAEAPKAKKDTPPDVDASKSKKMVSPEAETPKSKKVPAPEAKKAKTKSKKSSVTEATSDADNWSGLSETTLARKTVKELTDYLSSKGVMTNDEEGKPLKKALLVDAVRSL